MILIALRLMAGFFLAFWNASALSSRRDAGKAVSYSGDPDRPKPRPISACGLDFYTAGFI